MDDRPDEHHAPLRRGERFARRVTFDDASIRNFAALCGDYNPSMRRRKARSDR